MIGLVRFRCVKLEYNKNAIQNSKEHHIVVEWYFICFLVFCLESFPQSLHWLRVHHKRMSTDGKHCLSALAPSFPILFPVLTQIASHHTTTMWHHTSHTPMKQYVHTHDSSQGVWVVPSVECTGSVPLLLHLQCRCLYPHTYTWHTSSNTSICTLTTQVKVCELCKLCQALTQCLCPLYSNLILCTLTTHHTHINMTSHITHHTQSKTLTTQVKVCELCQVWQALTQCLCSLNSNFVVCTLTHTHQCDTTHHNTKWHIKAHTHYKSQGVWVVSNVASTDSVPLPPLFQYHSLHSHTHHTS